MEKLKIWMLPTLALIRQEKTVDYVIGFDDLGSKDDFTTEVATMYPPCNHRRVILCSKALSCSQSYSAQMSHHRNESGFTALA